MVDMKNILLLPGDGIGPEIIDQARKVLDEIKSNNLFDFSLETGFIGGAAYDKYKNPFPPETIENAKKLMVSLVLLEDLNMIIYLETYSA